MATVQLRLTQGVRPEPDHNAALGAAVLVAWGEAHPAEARAKHDAPLPSNYCLSEIYPARSAGRGGFWFRLGCTDDDQGRRMAGALVTKGTVMVKDATFQVEGIQDVTPRSIEGPVALHTLSPILLRDKKTKYCHISDVAKGTRGGTDADYGLRLEAVANHALARERPELGEIEIGATLPGKPRKRSLHGRQVFAQTAKFYIDGPPEALSYLMTRGIGWSRSHGFGCIEVVTP